MTINFRNMFVATASLAALAPVPASAHHMMDGVMPSTFGEGLLSGLGHPVIGLDHLAAVLAVGVLAALASRGFGVAVAFLAAMIGGVVLHLTSTDLPAAELLVGVSTAVLGGLVALRLAPSALPLAALFAVAGLVHGYALGESMVGAEPAPIGAYLMGLFVIQTAIAAVAYVATLSLAGAERRRSVALAAAGGLMMLAGGMTAASAAGILG